MPVHVTFKANVNAFSISISIFSTGNVTLHDVDEVRFDIMVLMYITLAWSALIFLSILVYFPAKPPSAPSVSASLERTDYLDGLKKLMKNGRFWILAFAFAVPNGLQSGWASVANVDLDAIGVSQIEAGWLSFWGGITGNLCALIAGAFADAVKKRMKLFVIVSYSVALISFIVFTLVYLKVIPHSNILLWASFILSGAGCSAPSPLFFELSCEVTYPIPESIGNGTVTWLANFPALIFLGILSIPGIDTSWMNWSYLGSLAVAIPVMFLFKEKYTRLDIDIKK